MSGLRPSKPNLITTKSENALRAPSESPKSKRFRPYKHISTAVSRTISLPLSSYKTNKKVDEENIEESNSMKKEKGQNFMSRFWGSFKGRGGSKACDISSTDIVDHVENESKIMKMKIIQILNLKKKMN